MGERGKNAGERPDPLRKRCWPGWSVSPLGVKNAAETILPPSLDFERLRRIVAVWPRDAEEIILMFKRQEWVYPIGTTGLSCLVADSVERGQRVAVDTSGCENLGYWGRMGFFENFGLGDLGKQGHSRASRGRFSVIQRLKALESYSQEAVEISPAMDRPLLAVGGEDSGKSRLKPDIDSLSRQISFLKENLQQSKAPGEKESANEKLTMSERALAEKQDKLNRINQYDQDYQRRQEDYEKGRRLIRGSSRCPRLTNI